MRAKKEKRKADMAKSLDIPQGLVEGYYLEIHSGKEAVLVGKCDVLKLEETVLKLKCGEHEISFLGKELCIETYSADSVSISGEITATELN